jgi:hypothetical protein
MRVAIKRASGILNRCRQVKTRWPPLATPENHVFKHMTDAAERWRLVARPYPDADRNADGTAAWQARRNDPYTTVKDSPPNISPYAP